MRELCRCLPGVSSEFREIVAPNATRKCSPTRLTVDTFVQYLDSVYSASGVIIPTTMFAPVRAHYFVIHFTWHVNRKLNEFISLQFYLRNILMLIAQLLLLTYFSPNVIFRIIFLQKIIYVYIFCN